MGDVIMFPVKCRACRSNTVPDDRRDALVPTCLECLPKRIAEEPTRPLDQRELDDMVKDVPRDVLRRVRDAKDELRKSSYEELQREIAAQQKKAPTTWDFFRRVLRGDESW